jgi:hypothetical protein
MHILWQIVGSHIQFVYISEIRSDRILVTGLGLLCHITPPKIHSVQDMLDDSYGRNELGLSSAAIAFPGSSSTRPLHCYKYICYKIYWLVTNANTQRAYLFAGWFSTIHAGPGQEKEICWLHLNLTTPLSHTWWSQPSMRPPSPWTGWSTCKISRYIAVSWHHINNLALDRQFGPRIFAFDTAQNIK